MCTRMFLEINILSPYPVPKSSISSPKKLKPKRVTDIHKEQDRSSMDPFAVPSTSNVPSSAHLTIWTCV